MRPIHAEYDPQAHAVYVTLSSSDTARTVEAADWLLFDTGTQGELVGVEMLTDELDAGEVRRLLHDHGLDQWSDDVIVAIAGVLSQTSAAGLVAPVQYHATSMVLGATDITVTVGTTGLGFSEVTDDACHAA